MRKTKKLSALILSAIMLATGCANNATPGGSTEVKDNSSAVSAVNDSTGTGDSGTDSGNSEPDMKSVRDAVKDIKVDTKVKVLAWYDLNNMDIAKTYKELFGVPENIPKGYEKGRAGKTGSGGVETEPFVDVRVTSYAERYTDLAKLIQADDSPDAFPAELYAMMYFNSNNKEKYFDPVDDVIDFGLSEFVPYSKIQNDIKMFDRDYCPIYNVTPSSVLWYRSSVIKTQDLKIRGSFTKRTSGHGASSLKCAKSSQTVNRQKKFSKMKQI